MAQAEHSVSVNANPGRTDVMGHLKKKKKKMKQMELEPQLKKIKAAKAKGARDLLVHIKQSHPPKFKSKLAEPAYDNIKQALRKASAEYHPDKQLQYDQKWQVLSGEISKAVNDVWADYCS
ncbi:TPA: hypothetical protein ACH3X1_006716 [Trebouxia sp. C0004]